MKGVKVSYSSIVLALDGIYSESHKPEALELAKVLSKPSTLFAIFLLEVLPQTAKLSKALQAVQLDLSAISSLVESTLYMLDAAIEPSANWILQLVDAREELATIIGVDIYCGIYRQYGKILCIKANISSRFGSQDVIAASSIFDPKKCLV